ncbi:hypothetical protein KKE13_00035 [Patescibacteria group bacterium]|nr:hypothetical protein [Patescibacteria group bacterium]
MRSIPARNMPPRPMSGTFVVPAGKGPEETKIWVNPREIVWLAANPKAKLFDCKSGQTIGITPDGWTSSPITKKGYLTFLKESTTSSVDYSIIN